MLDKTKIVAIDVSDQSILLLGLEDDKKTVAVYGKADVEPGVVKQGMVCDQDLFIKALDKLLSHTKPIKLNTEKENLRVALCVPERHLFSYHVTIPKDIPDDEIETYVNEQAQKIIPYKLELLYSTQHVAEEEGVKHVTFTGIQKTDLQNYVSVFSQAGLTIVYVAGELFALGRTYLSDPPMKEDHIILDTDYNSTIIGVYGVDVVPNLSVVVRRGSETIVRHLSEYLSLPLEEVRDLLMTHGLAAKQKKNKKFSELLQDSLGPVIDKVLQAKGYVEKHAAMTIKQITICGSLKEMPGLSDYIASQVGVPAVLVDDTQKIDGIKRILKGDRPEQLSGVIGLALSANDPKFSQINLLTQYNKEMTEVRKAGVTLESIRSLADLYHFIRVQMKKLVKIILEKGLQSKNVSSSKKSKASTVKTSFILVVFFGALGFLVWAMKNYV